MKECDGLRDLIVADYVDGELPKNVHSDIESHLLICPDCRAFAQEVKSNAVLPFQKIFRQAVPVGIWETIRQNIEQQNEKYNPLESFYNRFKGLVFVPRFVPVFAGFIVMFLAGSVALNTIQINRTQEKDQGEYLVSLLDTTGSLAQADNNGFGTAIEHYFL